jgi:hypothetical protein
MIRNKTGSFEENISKLHVRPMGKRPSFKHRRTHACAPCPPHTDRYKFTVVIRVVETTE